MMVRSVDEGSAKFAALMGYAIAGQSSLTSIAEHGHYGGKFNAGFGGFLPAGSEEPKAVIIVSITSPQKYEDLVAQMAFRSITMQIVGSLGIRPRADILYRDFSDAAKQKTRPVQPLH